LLAGADQERPIEVVVAAVGAAVRLVAAPGAVEGKIAADAADEALAPVDVIAFTVKVYEVPCVSPEIVADVPVRPVVAEPDDGVTV